MKVGANSALFAGNGSPGRYRLNSRNSSNEEICVPRVGIHSYHALTLAVSLFWGFKKGKPAIVPAGNRYTVFVHGDTKIKGKRTLASR